MDDERDAIQAEGLDPHDPAVQAAMDLVRWELECSALTQNDEAASPGQVR